MESKNKNRTFEKRAVLLNFISLIACIVMAITAPMLAFLVISCIFALLEAIHFIFGDITTSYRLAANPFFKWFGIVVTVIFFFFIVMGFFFLAEFTVFFLALLIAWLTEQSATCTRLKKKNNKIKGVRGLISLLYKRKIKKKKKKEKKFF